MHASKRIPSLFRLIGMGIGLALLTPTAAWAVGEQTGRLRGTVVDKQSNTAMPGVEVTVTSSALIGGPRKKFTDDQGSYVFEELPPGTYQVDFFLEGTSGV